MKPIIIIGMVSGGTSAVGGALAANGWHPGDGYPPYFESHLLNQALMGDKDWFSSPPDVTTLDLEAVLAEVEDRIGHDKFFLKAPGNAIYIGDKWAELDVQPLLVYRPWKNIRDSIARRGRGDWLAHEAELKGLVNRLKQLRSEHNWPYYEFGQPQDVLAEALGVPLPEPWLEPSQIGNGRSPQAFFESIPKEHLAALAAYGGIE